MVEASQTLCMHMVIEKHDIRLILNVLLFFQQFSLLLESLMSDK